MTTGTDGFVYQLKQPLDSLQGVWLSGNPREQFPPYDHGRRGNGNSHRLSSYLPQWLVPRNKIFQHGAPVVVPPFVLVVTYLCGWLTSAFRAGSLAICYWLLQAYFILNTNHYWGPRVITIWRHLRVDSANAFKVALNSCSTHTSMATSFSRKELEAVKVSVVYMHYNLWYYQVLLFVIYHITTW